MISIVGMRQVFALTPGLHAMTRELTGPSSGAEMTARVSIPVLLMQKTWSFMTPERAAAVWWRARPPIRRMAISRGW